MTLHHLLVFDLDALSCHVKEGFGEPALIPIFGANKRPSVTFADHRALGIRPEAKVSFTPGGTRRPCMLDTSAFCCSHRHVCVCVCVCVCPSHACRLDPSKAYALRRGCCTGATGGFVLFGREMKE